MPHQSNHIAQNHILQALILMSAAHLIIKNLHCQRGERLLFEQLNFSVCALQLIHIVGPNGSGKTSLLRILCGINEADSGSVLWQDQAIHKHPDFFNQLAYIGHKDGLKNELTACENLQFYQTLNSHRSPSLIDDYLHRLDILHCADLLTHQLSFGQRRRLAFARLLIKPYPLWVLDEPFTGIDSDGRQLIQQLCLQHLQNNGMIILTHHASLQQTELAQYTTELALSAPSPA